MTENLSKSEKMEEKWEVSRRNFLKMSLGAGIGASLACSSAIKSPEKLGKAYAGIKLGKEQKEFPVEISKDFKRMNHKNIAFMRGAWDEKIIPIAEEFGGKTMNLVPPSGEPGWTEVESAFAVAGWSVEFDFGFDSASGIANKGLYSWDGHVNERKTTFESPEEATKIIKKAANFLGASLVGIAEYDERWVYSNFYNPETGENPPVKFPFKPKSAIVMAIEMDYDAFRTAPSLIASAAAGNIYSQMATTSFKLATFLRQLGYHAIPCGNDTALSIPLAIQAGLGELSRAGILITEKYGPRVRLCKVFTDLELVPDKPVTFGVKEFCKVCMKCADHCPSGAITREIEPSFNPVSISNQPGAKKWYVDAEKCFKFWAENGGDCGSCIASCPYNKIDEWHHDLSKLATLTPAKPALRYLDELFGYGQTYNKKAIAGWWNK